MRTIEKYYLIDYENVHDGGLAGCKDLGGTEHVVIFFTEHAKTIDMNMIAKHGNAELEMEKVPTGKQSADMHIVSYLGYLAGKNGKNCEVIIVSKDKDFDNIIAFWKEKTGIKASRAEQIKKSLETKASANNGAKKTIPKVGYKKKTEPSKQTKKNPEPKTSADSRPKKTTPMVRSDKKERLRTEVLEAVGEEYEAGVANTVSQVVTNYYELYDKKLFALKVQNALKERYSNHQDVYKAIEPVLIKYTGNQ